MSASSNPGEFSEDDAKKAFEGAALTGMVSFLKTSFWHVLTSDEILPPEVRAAFKIDTVSLLKKAFDIAIKEFEDDCN